MVIEQLQYVRRLIHVNQNIYLLKRQYLATIDNCWFMFGSLFLVPYFGFFFFFFTLAYSSNFQVQNCVKPHILPDLEFIA